jgi:hypothetical protein
MGFENIFLGLRWRISIFSGFLLDFDMISIFRNEMFEK